MSLITEFVDILQAAAPSAVVRPLISKDKALPAVTYSVRNGVRDLFYVGSYGLRTTGFDVSVYSKTYAEMQTLKNALISALHGTTEIGSRSIITNIFESYDDDPEEIYSAIITVEVAD